MFSWMRSSDPNRRIRAQADELIDLMLNQKRTWRGWWEYEIKSLKDDEQYRLIIAREPALQVVTAHAAMQRAADMLINSRVSRCLDDPESLRFQLLLNLLAHLLCAKLELTDDDLKIMLRCFLQLDVSQTRRILEPLVIAAEQLQAKSTLSPELIDLLRQMHDRMPIAWSDDRRVAHRARRLANPDAALLVDDREPWAAAALTFVSALPKEIRERWKLFFDHAAAAKGSKPTARWRKNAALLTRSMPEADLREQLLSWFAAFDRPRTVGSESNWTVDENNAQIMKGLVWLTSIFAGDTLIRALTKVGLAGQRKIPGHGPRCTLLTNAVIHALSEIDHELAIGQLAILRARIKNKSVQKQIDAAMHLVAARLGITVEEVDELAVPTYGMTGIGVRTETFGEHTAELRIINSSSTELRWFGPTGKIFKSVPTAVKRDHPHELAELKSAAKDMELLLPSQRERIDRLFIDKKRWPLAVWRQRYADHPLLGPIVRRLIWQFHSQNNAVACVFHGDDFIDVDGRTVVIGDHDAEVSLWHPIDEPVDVVLGWRRRLELLQIQQPFKQAHREIYVLTDAERRTATYSNRFAGHVLKQHQFNALCQSRHWRNTLRLLVDASYSPPTRLLPAWNLRAEFWIEGLGDDFGSDTTDAGTFHYVGTDQVRFYPITAPQMEAHASGGGYRHYPSSDHSAHLDPLQLDRVPPIVFSEIMRDVDLFVGVSSIGNDPDWMDGGADARHNNYWRDYSFGELSASAVTRREVLSSILPRLHIADRCAIHDRWLVVRGNLRTYRIHMGSANILMEPNDQYLCIVPDSRRTIDGKLFLPFEGDARIAVILSKALLLADDAAITDPTIVSQIHSSIG